MTKESSRAGVPPSGNSFHEQTPKTITTGLVPPLRGHDHKGFRNRFNRYEAIKYDPSEGIPDTSNMHNYWRDFDGVWHPLQAEKEIHITQKGFDEPSNTREVGMETRIPESKWRWFGNAGHFICARWCQFHLCTKVGRYLVSTVGEYFPPDAILEINAETRGVELVGKGDARRADYMRKIGFETLGSERTFETMVFRAGSPCKAPDCKCGLPSIEPSELDSFGSNDAGEATEGHYRLCRKWAKRS